MPASRLTALQSEVLDAFFKRERSFYLTGGPALVVERTPQLVADKPSVGSIRLDSPEEILANKLCALLGRAEVRDLVDVRALELSGLSIERALEAGRRKDGGLTPGQLAWVLSQISIGDAAEIPGGGEATELRRYLHDLIDRLTVLARP